MGRAICCAENAKDFLLLLLSLVRVSVPEAAEALLKLCLLHVNAQVVVEDKTP